MPKKSELRIDQVLSDHGERLARIEEAVNNHLPSIIARIEKSVGLIDRRLWWFMGVLVAQALVVLFLK